MTNDSRTSIFGARLTSRHTKMAANGGTSNAAVISNDIANCALHHYHYCMSKGKPRSGDEWTVYAAIVAASYSATMQLKVVSCATGTKCTTVGPEGWILRDCHAEVLCRRGLTRVLLEEISENKLHLLEKCSDDDLRYRLRSDTTLHLYVSTSPCGDASIYPILNEEDMNFTGAKVIVQKDEESLHNGELLPVNGITSETCVAREDTQQLGVLRTKSGRSNLPQYLRSTSMSCSDKLLRWCVMGLQGSWLPFEIRLSSIVVSGDPNATSLEAQRQALERAICNRKQQVLEELQSRNAGCELARRLLDHEIAVHVVEEQFPDSKSTTSAINENNDMVSTYNACALESKEPCDVSRKRKRNDDKVEPTNKKRRKEKSPCGISLNWQWIDEGETEVVVGARGIRQGKKPRSDQDYVNMTSRLSRRALVRLANKNQTDEKSYREFKARQAYPSYIHDRNLVFSTRPFQGWLVGNSDFEIIS